MNGFVVLCLMLLTCLVRSQNLTSTCMSQGDCTECLKVANCFWCSSSSTCMQSSESSQVFEYGLNNLSSNIESFGNRLRSQKRKMTNNSNDQCDDIQSSCSTISINSILIIFVSVISSLSLICICIFYRFKYLYGGERTSTRPTLLPGRMTRSMALKKGFKDEDEIEWMCIICGCENKPSVSDCILCGTSFKFTQEYKERRRMRIQTKYDALKKERILLQKMTKQQNHYQSQKIKTSDSTSEKSTSEKSTESKKRRQSVVVVAKSSSSKYKESFGKEIIDVDKEQENDADLIDLDRMSISSESILSLKNNEADTNENSENDINAQSPNLTSSSIPMISEQEKAEAFNYRRLNQLSLRQKSARRRKMWQRQIDSSSGQVQWVRASPSQVKIGQAPLGYSSPQSYKFDFSFSLLNPFSKSIKPTTKQKQTDSRKASQASESSEEVYNPLTQSSRLREPLLYSLHNDPAAILLAAHRNNLADARTGSKDSFDDSTRMSNSPAYIMTDDDGSVRWEPVNPSNQVFSFNGEKPNQLKQIHAIDKMNSANPILSSSSGDSTEDIQYPLRVEDLLAITALPFREKQIWLLKQLTMIQKPWSAGLVPIEVSRDHILEMSHDEVMRVDPAELTKYFRMSFVGEPGLDAGGLSREWFLLVTQELFSPETGLFSRHNNDTLTGYSINPLSWVHRSNHLSYFRFAGRLLGKALLEQQCIVASLSLPLRKQILGQPISFSDLEFVDAELYRSLRWLKKCPPEEVENLCLDFTVTYDASAGQEGEHVLRELVPGGSDISVTAENRDLYLLARLRHRLFDSVKPQLLSLLKGLQEVVPGEMLQVFDYQELDLLLCGVVEVNVDDWQKHTDYMGEYRRRAAETPTHRVIDWFWQCVREMSGEERVRLLQFVTGCNRLPPQGFRALQSSDGNYRYFNIQSIHKKDSLYPRAHTCFNKLDLPLYDSQEELDAYLSLVINMDVTGFSME